MNKDNYDKSEEVLREQEKLINLTNKEVEDARNEMDFLGIDNSNLYRLDINKEEEKDDDNYYRKSA